MTFQFFILFLLLLLLPSLPVNQLRLVGGSTRICAVQELVRELVGGKELNQSVPWPAGHCFEMSECSGTACMTFIFPHCHTRYQPFRWTGCLHHLTILESGHLIREFVGES